MTDTTTTSDSMIKEDSEGEARYNGSVSAPVNNGISLRVLFDSIECLEDRIQKIMPQSG